MPETAWERRVRRENARTEWLKTHENRCEICGNEPKSRGLSEDHEHRSGEHRGWLCHRCNRALPTWVTVEWLARAAVYLAFAAGETQFFPLAEVLGDAHAERMGRDL